jgi:hypothetical protein
VRLAAQIKLLPDKSQAEALLLTLRTAKDACIFPWVSCGFVDYIAAENIRRAAINQPIVVRADS